MASYTLAEMAKRERNPMRRAVLTAYGEGMALSEFADWQSIDGGALSYTTRTLLPSVGFRGVNESYTPSVGSVNPQTESLRIAGGEIKVDDYILRTQASRGAGDLLGSEIEAQGQAMGKFLTWAFFKGDAAVDPREFDGLQRRLVGTQRIDNGSTDGGDPLTLAKLDELIDAVVGNVGEKVLCMNKWLVRKVNALMRAAGQSQETVGSDFGTIYKAYQGIPIVQIEEDHEDNDILGFDETGPGGSTATCASIYCVNFKADSRVSMLQGRDGMMVTPLGTLQGQPATSVRVEWDVALAIFHGRAAGRLWGVKQV